MSTNDAGKRGLRSAHWPTGGRFGSAAANIRVTTKVWSYVVRASLVGLALVVAASPARAVTKCTVKIDSKSGTLQVSASDVVGDLRWGPSGGQETNAFSNESQCLVPGKAKKCELGAPGSAAQITPPELCRIFLADDVDECSAYIRGCVPGIRPGSALTAPAVRTTVHDVRCHGLDGVAPNADAKVVDTGTFTKESASSVVEVTFTGRIAVLSMNGTGVRFEVRVDDAATGNPRARATVKSDEVGSSGVAATFSRIFTGLPAGTHTVSIWAYSYYGTATGLYVDPGCWSSDAVIVKEFPA